MTGCECEHESHFGEDNDVDGGGPSENHPYADNAGPLTEVATIYGKVMICKFCQDNHPIPDSLLDKEGKGKDA